MKTSYSYFISQEEMLPGRSAPIAYVGLIGWLRKNLFSSWINSVFSLLGLLLIWTVITGFADWAYFTADFEGENRLECTNSVRVGPGSIRGFNNFFMVSIHLNKFGE